MKTLIVLIIAFHTLISYASEKKEVARKPASTFTVDTYVEATPT